MLKFSLTSPAVCLCVGLGLMLAADATQAQSFQFPQRPFGLGAANGSVSQATSAVASDTKAIFHRAGLDYSRNAAWPTPFSEMDRGSYRAIFQPCFDRGWELEATLSDACFDEAGRLNRLGAAKIAQVQRHSPLDRRTVYVYGEQPQIVDARLAMVRQHIEVEHGRSANLLVSSTGHFPVTGRGSYGEAVTRALRDSLPTPAINGQSVSGAVGGEQSQQSP